MAAPDPAIERTGLLRSIAATAMLGALGVGWGLAVGSQMILLDGVYAVIGLAVSWLLLRASALAREGPSRRYPFGREAVTPLVIGVQGSLLLATLLYAAIEAVYVIREGGTSFAAGWAIAYAVIGTAVSAAVWLWLRRLSGHSDLLVAEATAWGVSTLRSVGMILGFVVMAVLTGSSWDAAAPYVDPVMVLVTCALFVAAPLRMVRTTIIELLERAPKASIHEPVLAAVAAAAATHGVELPEVRVSKLGPKLYVEVEGHVDPTLTVGDVHDVREDLRCRLDALPYDVWLNVDLIPRGGIVNEPAATRTD